MTESHAEQLSKALKARESRVSPTQRKLREETDARNAAIQAAPIHLMRFGCPKDKS